ncbi:MAG: hypothetical protein M3070_03915 [Actinomycetota bacterium]|nr:hypothetical protein [Actinomycetota bacterium]
MKPSFRIAGPILSGFAVVLSFGAIELESTRYAAEDTYGQYFGRRSTGFWIAILGFAIIGAAGIIGPRKL